MKDSLMEPTLIYQFPLALVDQKDSGAYEVTEYREDDEYHTYWGMLVENLTIGEIAHGRYVLKGMKRKYYETWAGKYMTEDEAHAILDGSAFALMEKRKEHLLWGEEKLFLSSHNHYLYKKRIPIHIEHFGMLTIRHRVGD